MRFLHTMLRVGDLDRSIKFYTEVLGMKLLRQKDYPDGRFTLAFIGYGVESENTVIELTHNWDTDSYDLGSGYGHIALEVILVDPDRLRVGRRRPSGPQLVSRGRERPRGGREPRRRLIR